MCVLCVCGFFFFKQKTAYEMRISDWSSDVCSSDLACKGKDCGTPALMSAFRWNGLNLATVDKQLGRYFGTDHGVLVLSNGELAGLHAGDVIQDRKSVV